MGPTVWELEGPIPTLNKSNTLIDIRLPTREVYVGEESTAEERAQIAQELCLFPLIFSGQGNLLRALTRLLCSVRRADGGAKSCAIPDHAWKPT